MVAFFLLAVATLMEGALPGVAHKGLGTEKLR
jgi:hypothetical protein